jgi:hypothetical protein
MLIVDLTTVYYILYPRDDLTSLGLDAVPFALLLYLFQVLGPCNRYDFHAMKFLRNLYESFPQLECFKVCLRI